MENRFAVGYMSVGEPDKVTPETAMTTRAPAMLQRRGKLHN